MIRLAAFEPEHMVRLDVQDAQTDVDAQTRLDIALAQASYGPAWTAFHGDDVIAVGGICDTWAGRGIGWSGLSRHAGPHMLALTRLIRRVHESTDYRRIEMFVDPAHAAAIRWAALLKFRNETPEPMQGFLPDGRPAYLFARVFPR